jgi:ERCC4-type nuclease
MKLLLGLKHLSWRLAISQSEFFNFKCRWRSRNEEAFDVQFGDNIKSGKTFKETWQKMLECIPFVTEAKAIAIVEQYPSFNCLYSKYTTMTQRDGERLLTNICSLGNTTSKRIYDAFMSKSTQAHVLSQ